jgi:hypothetical protein
LLEIEFLLLVDFDLAVTVEELQDVGNRLLQFKAANVSDASLQLGLAKVLIHSEETSPRSSVSPSLTHLSSNEQLLTNSLQPTATSPSSFEKLF